MGDLNYGQLLISAIFILFPTISHSIFVYFHSINCSSILFPFYQLFFHSIFVYFHSINCSSILAILYNQMHYDLSAWVYVHV